MIVLDKLHNQHDCDTIIKQIESALAATIDLHGLRLNLTASIGLAMYPDDGASEDDLVRAADASMYDIKTGSHKPAP